MVNQRWKQQNSLSWIKKKLKKKYKKKKERKRQDLTVGLKLRYPAAVLLANIY